MDEERSESSIPYIVTHEVRKSYAADLVLPYYFKGISEKSNYIAWQIDYEDRVEVFSDERIGVKCCPDVYLKLYLTNIHRVSGIISRPYRHIYADVIVEEVWKNKDCVRPLLYKYIWISIPTDFSNVILDNSGYIKQGSINLRVPILNRILCVVKPPHITSIEPCTVTFDIPHVQYDDLITISYQIEMLPETMQASGEAGLLDDRMFMPELPIFHLKWKPLNDNSKCKNRSPPAASCYILQHIVPG